MQWQTTILKKEARLEGGGGESARQEETKKAKGRMRSYVPAIYK